MTLDLFHIDIVNPLFVLDSSGFRLFGSWKICGMCVWFGVYLMAILLGIRNNDIIFSIGTNLLLFKLGNNRFFLYMFSV